MTTRVISLLAVLFVACGSPRDQGAPKAQAGRQPSGTLDQLLAPIALYPDPLLAQMLMSATAPAKITELDGWLKKNQKLTGTPLQDAAVKAGFDPSFVALALFPQVVAKMANARRTTVLKGDYTPGQLLTLVGHFAFAAIGCGSGRHHQPRAHAAGSSEAEGGLRTQ